MHTHRLGAAWLVFAKRAVVISGLATAGGCSATAIVRPLPHGTSAWTASLGGPYLPSNVPTLVVPYLTIGDGTVTAIGQFVAHMLAMT